MSFPDERLSCRIAVLTYLRPDDLAEVLPQLIAETREVDVDARIIVVDNDPAGGARAFVDGFDPHVVEYRHEPVPGIAAARNTALAAASHADVLIFIDDDERPVDGWLAMLLSLYRERRPAAVVGPVVSRFGGTLDPWIDAGRFFHRRRMPTGSRITVAATNNLLVDMHVVERLGLRFDTAFGISGGSDTLFTRQLAASGAPMLWHDEAVVEDVVPANRQTRAWVLQRAFRSGNSWSRTALVLERNRSLRLLLRLRLTVDGLVRLAGGSLQVAAGRVIRSVAFDARGHRTLRRGAGMLSGAWGHQYLEYRRPITGVGDGKTQAPPG